jgi:hypothetical protein
MMQPKEQGRNSWLKPVLWIAGVTAIITPPFAIYIAPSLLEVSALLASPQATQPSTEESKVDHLIWPEGVPVNPGDEDRPAAP